jgi:hypothetical protein
MVSISFKKGEIEVIYDALMKRENNELDETELKYVKSSMKKISKY